MEKDKSANADKSEPVLPTRSTTDTSVKKIRFVGVLRFVAAVLLILMASTAALFYYQTFMTESIGVNTQKINDDKQQIRHPVIPEVRETKIQTPPTPVAQQPQEKITEIKYIIPESITNSINGLHDKVGKMETLADQYMNIKADSSAVISLGERLDKLEKRTEKLAKISNSGALILTAALMIRENAAAGQSVRFEAEMLKQLAADQTDLETAVNYIYNNSSRQYPANKSLNKSFNRISRRMIYDLKHQGNWKDRLLRKISEYIHISTPQSDSRENMEIKTLEEMRDYVDEGQFALAVELLSRPENKPLLTDEALNQWFLITDSKLKFNRFLSEICAYSLSLMKTEELKDVALP